MRIDVRKGEQLKDKNEVIGNHVKCKVAKNKVAPPFHVAEFDILYGQGISRESEIIDLSVEMGIVQKSGAWFSYKGERVAQGKEKLRIYLKEHPEVAEEIAAQVIERAKAAPEKPVSAESLFGGEDEEEDELDLDGLN